MTGPPHDDPHPLALMPFAGDPTVAVAAPTYWPYNTEGIE